MKKIQLNADQIITLNDYPVFSDKVLSEYFKKCKRGEKVAFVPVMRKEIVRKYLDKELLQVFEEFEQKNPLAEFFMLDGSHRTTAMTHAGCRIDSILYEKDEDIREAKGLVATGQIIENGTLNHTLVENCEILNKHFSEKPYFMTVEQKTKKMVDEGVLPRGMRCGNMGFFLFI